MAKKLTLTDIRKFRSTIYGHYKKNSRKLPWRPPALKLRKDNALDPYRIVVSEIMLQQTQVSRVLTKYPTFIKTFPNFKSLAKAPFKKIFRVWQGMGYNRRALALKKIAERVEKEFGGKLPVSPETLETFPGIGHYTACAISAFAYNQPTVFIETNIRTVFIYFFFPKKKRARPVTLQLANRNPSSKTHSTTAYAPMTTKTSESNGVNDEELLPFIKQTLDRHNPREWYYALMDYGAMLKEKGARLNKRSAHYRAQSRFKGSNRELRGKILEMLSQRNMSEVELVRALRKKGTLVKKNLITLMIEGLIKKRGKKIVIP